jgi:hypothetical protein
MADEEVPGVAFVTAKRVTTRLRIPALSLTESHSRMVNIGEVELLDALAADREATGMAEMQGQESGT